MIMRMATLCVGIVVLNGCQGAEERPGEVIGDTIEDIQTSVVGWASQTGYRKASTPVQIAIVATAEAAAGGSSGASFVVAPIGNTTPWQTDIAGGDGVRMRNAYKRYYNWQNNPGGQTFNQVRTAMIADFSSSAYDSLRKGLLVDHIIAIVGAPGTYGPFEPAPATDQDTLTRFGIRKQCLEWAVTTALQGGGKAKGYSASAVTNLANVRPGMGLYKSDHSHAMIIVDVEWNANGVPVNYKVAESNWGGGWMNPTGMIPWQRTTDVGRLVPATSSVFVVDYEN